MRSDHLSARRWRRQRRIWSSVAALTMLSPTVIAPLGALPLAVAAGAAVAGALLPWPSGRVRLATVASAVAVVSLLVDLGYAWQQGPVLVWLPFEWAALLVLLHRVVRRVPGRRVAGFSVLTGAVAAVLPLRFTLRAPVLHPGPSAVAVALSLLGVAGAAGVGAYLRALDGRRVRAVARARREQRLEVARDLHDFVAHEITGIVLEAQAAQLSGDDPAETRALLHRLEEAGLRALDAMDDTVRALREPADADGTAGAADTATHEPPPTRVYGLADLADLTSRFSTTGTTRASLDLEPGLAGALPRETEGAAYAVVLEALTNVRRHAAGSRRVAVRVERATGADGRPAVAVSVTDDGGPGALARRPRSGGGTGLAAAAERIAALGGTFVAGPVNRSVAGAAATDAGATEPAGAGPAADGRTAAPGRTGWQVSCLLPLRADAQRVRPPIADTEDGRPPISAER
ncbi:MULTISPECIES: sensor histidine kinase [Kitasatospora]|uniref:histidine kinase n=1 Tax=Kitasatospora cystarginea TaxID=58350 RepID=A0ABN3DEZ4_9ACTN